MDGRTDGWTDGRTDGQTLLQRCEDASKKGSDLIGSEEIDNVED